MTEHRNFRGQKLHLNLRRVMILRFMIEHGQVTMDQLAAEFSARCYYKSILTFMQKDGLVDFDGNTFVATELASSMMEEVERDSSLLFA